MAIDAANEVLLCGQWSVRTLGKDLGLVYVNVETGEHQSEPPREVLFALEMGGDLEEDAEKAYAESQGGRGAAESPSPQPTRAAEPSDDEADLGGPAPSLSPRYRRVVLGTSCEVPLMMAKDILNVLREDPSIAPTVQKRFSEFPSERPFRLSELQGGACGNEGEVESLQVGQVTEILHADDSSLQIFVRVA